MAIKIKRENALIPNGVPRYIRCYDNGGETFDRYTVLFTKKAAINGFGDRWFIYLGMSERPTHPQGFGQWGESHMRPLDADGYSHLGRKIGFDQLPPECQGLVMMEYRDLWGL